MNSENEALQNRQHRNLIAIRQAYEDAEVALNSMTDFEEAYQLATQLADGLRTLADAAALARARSAAQISEAEALSLAGLATKLGVSKARASQLLRAARGREEKKSADR
ncbi:hypothetical protein E1267_39825 [Nonomuraea longispora]|uniref:Uncharacterized protein n=1 Tax=Nonomuraea longispora TaxID=1848320 RepID=A0A4R4MN81_9ACTN|nr:hypothetical protein [Nonomuraea longispora]TDB97420.1 hypothetical protein E1267_39825 [Nonomuraea longispora]